MGGAPEIRSSRPAWPRWWNPVSTQTTKLSWAWWRANPSYSGGWDRRIAWTWEVEVAVSQDHTTALQPGHQSETPSQKQTTNKQTTKKWSSKAGMHTRSAWPQNSRAISEKSDFTILLAHSGGSGVEDGERSWLPQSRSRLLISLAVGASYLTFLSFSFLIYIKWKIRLVLTSNICCDD